MSYINTNTYYKIARITNLYENDRKDGRYPQRIGRRFKFLFEPEPDNVMMLTYCPRNREDYEGVLRTSRVKYIQTSLFGDLTIGTKNSIYYFEKEGVALDEMA